MMLDGKDVVLGRARSRDLEGLFIATSYRQKDGAVSTSPRTFFNVRDCGSARVQCRVVARAMVM